MKQRDGRTRDREQTVARRESTPGRRTLTEGPPGATPTTGDVATAAVATKSSGTPLPGDVRRQIEPHLGADLSNVRVHGDGNARAASAALGARAFTYGSDIFLGSGESAANTHLMAHEATHVVQQGAAAAPQRKIEVGAEDHPSEREADAVADRVVAGVPASNKRIVDDEVPAGEGQIHRSEFLRMLRENVDRTAAGALGPLLSVSSCPYIEQWFAQHASTDAASLERLAVRFAGVKNAATASDYLAPIGARLQQGIERWRSGADVAPELSAAGLGAAAQAAAATPPPREGEGEGEGSATATNHAAMAADDAASAKAPNGTDDAAGLAEIAEGPIAQRKKRGVALDPESPAQVAAELGPGQSLDSGTASRMGGAFGQDFGHVRVHTDDSAARMASQLGAHAFTVGEHVAFGAGNYAPGSLPGDALLAHELAHVVQQTGTVARKPATDGGADVGVDSRESPALEDDADQAASAVVTQLHGGAAAAAKHEAPTTMRSGLALRRCDSGKTVAPAVKPEIDATGDAMGKRVVDDMNKANTGPSSLDAGIHYWYNYRALCTGSNKSRWDDKLKAGMADAKYWNRYGWKQWRLKPGVSASEGLKSWLKGPTIAECRSAILAFETDAMRAAIGDAKFDEMFGSVSGTPSAGLLVIDSQGNASSVSSYMKTTDAAAKGVAGTVGNRPVKAGEWYYFYNHSMLLAKHPASSWQGENALFLGTNGAGKQIWAGLGTSDGGGHSEVTEEQMYQQMADTYNKPRNPDDIAKLDEIKKANGGTLPAIYDESKLPTAMDQAKILADAGSDAVDGTFRKGGFSVGAGKTLDTAKIAALKP